MKIWLQFQPATQIRSSLLFHLLQVPQSGHKFSVSLTFILILFKNEILCLNNCNLICVIIFKDVVFLLPLVQLCKYGSKSFHAVCCINVIITFLEALVGRWLTSDFQVAHGSNPFELEPCEALKIVINKFNFFMK